MLRKQENGMYLSSRDKTCKEDISSYKDINFEVLEQLDKVENKMTFLAEQLDYKLAFG